MKQEHKDILKAKKFDPLAQAELLTGNSYKDDEQTSTLGFSLQLQKSNYLDELISSIGDTKLSNKISDYLTITSNFGFEIIYQEDFTCENRHEKMYILFHFELSILICFDTFTWEFETEPNVNGGKMYYNWSPNNPFRNGLTNSGGFYSEKSDHPHLTLFEKDFSLPFYIPDYPITPLWADNLSHTQFKAICEPIEKQQNALFENALKEGKRTVWVGDHDCREAVITTIKSMWENGKFLKEWKECAFSWLTHYQDHKNKNYNYPFTNHYNKTKNIIAQFPLHVQKAIGSYQP